MNNISTPSGISLVLVDTRTPANIGAVARSMMNMGLKRLILVNPPDDREGAARRLAAGAESILDSASVYSSLQNAVAGHSLVIGVSRHRGRLRKNVHTPREMAAFAAPLRETNRIAVVFGNEVNGLEKQHLALCQEFVAIPSSADFPSLNLSHAVVVIAYELFIAGYSRAPILARELAAGRERENFYEHLQSTLQTIGFLDRDNPERMMFSLRQLFGRSRPDERDLNILRGILSAIDRMAGKPG